jgi:hypothetical protein
MVGGLGRDWAPRAVSEDGIVVQVQGYRWCCRWRADLVGTRAVLVGVRLG